MTAITTAARLLREAAAELKNAHTLGGDWGNEHEALDAYNEHMATATTLEHMARQCLAQIEEPAGAAPAAVAGPAGWEPDDDSRPRSRADLARVLDEWNDVTGCIPRMSSWRVEVLSIIEDAFDLGMFLGEKAHLAPALEAPAAQVGDEEAAFTKWFQGEQGKPYQGMWEFARAAWMARAATAAAPQAPAAPAVDASDTALLDAMERERIAVIPEFEGPWDAQIFGEDEATLACGSGVTPRKAIAEAIASLEARKAHDAAQAAAKGA